jgi:maltose alpha-D-glucosyltransferase/alpha-amylase
MLGRRTAELHQTLSQSTDPAFAPEPLDREALDALATHMRSHGEATLTALGQGLRGLSEIARVHAHAIVDKREALLSRFDALRGLSDAGFRMRVHGDYHLGQVLRTEEDFVILDFEGEPARSIAERRQKHSPLKDVAGMVRSYSYAAYAALFTFTTHAPGDFASLEPWADAWQHWSAQAFLTGYLAAAGDVFFMPRGPALAVLLRAFVLDKALYELGYELNHRPDWARIPLAGMQKLIGT